MAISSEAFRDSLRFFPSGVTVVTIKSGDKIHGLTVSAFASVSTKPPLILICIDQRHSAFKIMESDNVTFAVNILHEDQMDVSNRFAWLKDEDRFQESDWDTAITGAPILTEAIAWLDCTIHSSHVAGSHTIYIGEVQATGIPKPDSLPLIYWNRGYRHLGSIPKD